MQTKFFALTVALSLTLSSAAPVAAQNRQSCAARDTVVSYLLDKYGEHRQSIGLGANNSVVETFASDQTGTWTIVITMPSGVSCLMASGQAYEEVMGEPVASTDEDA